MPSLPSSAALVVSLIASLLASLLALLLAALLPAPAAAGTLDEQALARWFPAPLAIGPRDADLPVWPIFRRNGPTTELAGYAFESIDLAPIPGFSGTPMNLLIALGAGGEFLDVRVLSHHEPVFLDGLGEQPLHDFAAQYRGLSLRRGVRIGGGAGSAGGAGHAGGAGTDAGGAIDAGGADRIDGIAKATASVRILNQSVLAASLQVARARLGFSGAVTPDRVARVRADRWRPLDWAQLRAEGLVQERVLREREVDAAFSDSTAAEADRAGAPEDVFVALRATLATVPAAGRNLLDAAGWRSLQARIEPGDQVLLVMSTGRHGIAGDDFVRGAVPERLALRQGGLPIELRDLDLDGAIVAAGAPEIGTWKAFRVLAQAGLDPGRPFELALRVTRSRGTPWGERVQREFALPVSVPASFLVAPAPQEAGGWRAVWQARATELAVLVAALALLAWVLARQTRLVTDRRRLAWFRPLFLAFTLAFVGWHLQAQLSIVNLVAVLQAGLQGRGLGFLLYDPATLLLLGFALATLVIWGRGTFCGWLCPFGALQELAARLARAARVPRLRLRPRADRIARRAKYGVLAAIVVAAVVPALPGMGSTGGAASTGAAGGAGGAGGTAGAAGWTAPRVVDALVEVEPFKTAITLGFARAWPFVAWAAGLVALGAVLNKAFCRYLCPLGAALALGGRLRRWQWIARRAECGTPCQTCRHRCEYRAIEPSGRIDYAECFQCMDCVAIHASDTLCAPRILERRRARRTIPIVAAAPPPGRAAMSDPAGAAPRPLDQVLETRR